MFSVYVMTKCTFVQYPVLAGNFLGIADRPTWQPKPTGRHWLPCPALESGKCTFFAVFQLRNLLFRGSVVLFVEKGIEHLKKESGKWKKRTCWMNLQDVFGGPFSYIWFSPFHHAATAYDDSGPPEVCVYSTL